MDIKDKILEFLKNLLGSAKNQIAAFRAILKIRSARAKNTSDASIKINQPNWQMILVLGFSAIAASFLFVDVAAYHWKSTISPATFAFFRMLTDLGKSEILLVPAGLAILVLGAVSWAKASKGLKARLVQIQLLGLYVFVAIAGSGLTNNLLKILIGRARPRNFEELGAYHFAPLGLDSGFQSFPSGHSTTAGAMTIILILLLPRLKWTWIALGGWIAFSRVVVGAHYPSDAIAGFLYGSSFAWLAAAWFCRRRLLFVAKNGHICLPETSALNPAKVYKSLHMLFQKA